MAVESVRCPHCQSGAVGTYGTSINGKERFRCTAATCGRTFIGAYALSCSFPVCGCHQLAVRHSPLLVVRAVDERLLISAREACIPFRLPIVNWSLTLPTNPSCGYRNWVVGAELDVRYPTGGTARPHGC